MPPLTAFSLRAGARKPFTRVPFPGRARVMRISNRVLQTSLPFARTAVEIDLPMITGISVDESGDHIDFTSEPGLQYRLRRTADPSARDWTNLPDVYTATGTKTTGVDSSPSPDKAFYGVTVGTLAP